MENGLVQVYCGEGKGKTTAAIGLGIRAIGNDYKVIMLQFLKKDTNGECQMIKQLEPNFKIFHFEKKRGFTWQLTEEEKQELKSETTNAMNFAMKVMDTGQCDILILDEILNSLEYGFVTEEEVCALIDAKTDDVELILTGKKLPDSIAKRADYISKIEDVKHPIDKGTRARRGIEF